MFRIVPAHSESRDDVSQLPATDTSTGSTIVSDTAAQLQQPRRLVGVFIGHTAIDTYSAFLPPILLVLQTRADLTRAEAAWLLGTGPVASGLSQPVSAWLSDRFDSRLFVGLGLLIAAVCLSCIGIATNFWSLIVLYAIGTIGVGIFHPVGAATAGQLSQHSLRGNRSLGLSIFFVAGMAGGVLGSMLSPMLVQQSNGFRWLAACALPGVVLAIVLYAALRKVPHRNVTHREDASILDNIAGRWWMVSLLWLGNAIRFTVNIALIYLVLRWAELQISLAQPLLNEQEVVEVAAPLGGRLLALMMLGMAVGGMSAGALVKAGRERLPLLLLPILLSPMIFFLPRCGVVAAHLFVVGAGIAFASLIPVTLGLAQRLLPHRTSLASGLMLGGAWAVAIVGPRLAELALASGVTLEMTFAMTAGALAVSGIVALFFDRETLERSAS